MKKITGKKINSGPTCKEWSGAQAHEAQEKLDVRSCHSTSPNLRFHGHAVLFCFFVGWSLSKNSTAILWELHSRFFFFLPGIQLASCNYQVKLCAYRLEFFCKLWNWFDLLLVSLEFALDIITLVFALFLFFIFKFKYTRALFFPPSDSQNQNLQIVSESSEPTLLCLAWQKTISIHEEGLPYGSSFAPKMGNGDEKKHRTEVVVWIRCVSIFQVISFLFGNFGWESLLPMNGHEKLDLFLGWIQQQASIYWIDILNMYWLSV